MKRIFVFTLLSFVLSLQHLSSQSQICGYDDEIARLKAKYPNFQYWQDQMYQKALSLYNEQISAKRQIVADTLYFEIPVVFHILYNEAEENIDDSLIYSQLQILNEAFRLRNADTAGIRSFFKPIAADVKVQFVLADKDPNGQTTNGIIRKATTQAHFARNQFGGYTTNMKFDNRGGSDAWDPTRYLNFWICDMQYPNGFSIVYGYATPAFGSPNWENFTGSTKTPADPETGVVIHYKVLGRNNPLAPNAYRKGKTAIHEVGHYLGLRHVWGDGSGASGCQVDDGIEDTPNTMAQNALCNNQNTCGSGTPGDLPDQTENYMDYSLDACAAMFTKQQAAIMQYVLVGLRPDVSTATIVYDTIPDGNQFTVFPNPVTNNGYLNITHSGFRNQNFSLEIYGFDGRVIRMIDGIRDNSTFQFSTAELANAAYWMIIRGAKGEILYSSRLLLL